MVSIYPRMPRSKQLHGITEYGVCMHRYISNCYTGINYSAHRNFEIIRLQSMHRYIVLCNYVFYVHSIYTVIRISIITPFTYSDTVVRRLND